MDIQYINSCINVRINDIWLESWNARINSTYRCTYFFFNTDVFMFENYWLMDDKYRINISKFRCRYNHLPISSKYSLDYDCDIKCDICLQMILEMNIIILLDVITFYMKGNCLYINIIYMYNTQVFTNVSNSCRQRTPQTVLILHDSSQ